MPLAPGSRLGPYEVVSPLGSGGMGEVYRATDLRLGRQVAIKVLPERLAKDGEALARFEREARAVAALSHPSICTLHDVGREGEVSYLVMELLEGETLAARVLRGPLPLEQALRIGSQIGDALAAAHDRGIVHRDLKPGNVMLTRSGVKLLDFGLAKALAPADDGAGEPAPTGTVDVTQEGTLLGTLPYMAPEQLEGRRADARADIFALGTVLHEMVTGRPAFSGKSQASLIAAILGSEPPPVSSIRLLTPAALDHLVRTCLAKDPTERWQSARDIVLQLRAIAEAEPAQTPSRSGHLAKIPWVLAGLAVALSLAFHLRERPIQRAPRTVRLTVAPPPGGAFTSWAEATAIAVSPDGSALAFSARDAEGKTGLWLRPLSSTESRLLSGSEGATAPFWSPDGRSLGFIAQGKLKRLDIAGGAPITICDVPAGGGVAASWGRDSILFVPTPAAGNALYRVPSGGGAAVAEIKPDPSKGERRIAWPSFLPGGERFLYIVRHEDVSSRLMLSEPGRRPRPLGTIASAAQYQGPGHLVFVREGTLVAQRFDLKDGRLSGEPTSIAETIRYFLSTSSAAFSASPSGTLAYQPFVDVNRLVWFDRAGRELGTVGAPGDHRSLAVAPDGLRVLYDRARPGTGTLDVWSWDSPMQVESRLTSHAQNELTPRWLPGAAVVYSTQGQGGAPRLVRRDLATGTEEPLVAGSVPFQFAEDVSSDGTTLVYSQRGEAGTFDLWTLPLAGAREPKALLVSPAQEGGARFSPDGRFLAFLSDESGRSEAYVMPHPGPGEKRRISSNGAHAVRWSRDGREIFLLSADGRLWSLPVRTAPSFQAAAPTLVFALAGKPWISFDVSPDGRRFLAIVPQVVGNELPATVVVNWTGESSP